MYIQYLALIMCSVCRQTAHVLSYLLLNFITHIHVQHIINSLHSIAVPAFLKPILNFIDKRVFSTVYMQYPFAVYHIPVRGARL